VIQMSAELEYYNSLLAQGYSAEHALFYTQKYYPYFSHESNLQVGLPPQQVQQPQYIQPTVASHAGWICSHDLHNNTIAGCLN